MKGAIPITIVTVATVAAAAAVWFWALRPLGFASYLSSTDATDADIIRRYWPHRLIEPEWIGASPEKLDRLMKWHIYETVARLSVVGLLWFVITGGVVYEFVRRRRVRLTTRCSERRHHVMVAAGASCGRRCWVV